jgi:hypothetical protein
MNFKARHKFLLSLLSLFSFSVALSPVVPIASVYYANSCVGYAKVSKDC